MPNCFKHEHINVIEDQDEDGKRSYIVSCPDCGFSHIVVGNRELLDKTINYITSDNFTMKEAEAKRTKESQNSH